jgi:hypothetical protein
MNFIPGDVCCMFVMKTTHLMELALPPQHMFTVLGAFFSDWKKGRVGTDTDTGAPLTNANAAPQNFGKPLARSRFNAMWAHRMPYVKVGLSWFDHNKPCCY